MSSRRTSSKRRSRKARVPRSARSNTSRYLSGAIPIPSWPSTCTATTAEVSSKFSPQQIQLARTNGKSSAASAAAKAAPDDAIGGGAGVVGLGISGGEGSGGWGERRG